MATSIQRLAEHPVVQVDGPATFMGVLLDAAISCICRARLLIQSCCDGAVGASVDELGQRDSLAMCFSTTKGLTSRALHLLADRGLVRYDAPVAEYWPESVAGARRGSPSPTCSHPLGWPAPDPLDHRPGGADVRLDHMVDALARATPAHEPGTQNGYHALTYGWPMGEVVRRVSGQPLDRFAQSEIAEALDLEPTGTTHRPRSSEK